MIKNLKQARVLVADDEEAIRRMMAAFLEGQGYKPVLARDGEEALTLAQKEHPDLVILDVNMPGLNGIEVCRRIKSHAQLRLISVILITSLHDVQSRVAGLEAGADDFFTKPFEPTEVSARVKSLLTLKHYTDELEHAEAVITSLALCVEAKDPYTAGHCERLSHYGIDLGKSIGLTEDELRAIRLGGVLHDLGKLAVPDAILLKPGPLTAEERKVIEVHPLTGAQLCEPLKSLGNIIPMIKYHHEKWNGTGYPDRLKGESIPISARIMAIVDVFDALHTKRSYKPSLSVLESLRILEEEAGRGFWDPYLVGQFSELVRQKFKNG